MSLYYICHLVLFNQLPKAVVELPRAVVLPLLPLPPLLEVGLQPHQRLVPLHVALLEQPHPDGHEQRVVGPVQAWWLVPELTQSALFVLAVESFGTSFQKITFALKFALINLKTLFWSVQGATGQRTAAAMQTADA